MASHTPGKAFFSPEEINTLKQNQYIIMISRGVRSDRITYTLKMKKEFSKLYDQGLTPREIFALFDIPYALIGDKRIERCAYRWRRKYKPSSRRPAPQRAGQT